MRFVVASYPSPSPTDRQPFQRSEKSKQKKQPDALTKRYVFVPSLVLSLRPSDTDP